MIYCFQNEALFYHFNSERSRLFGYMDREEYISDSQVVKRANASVRWAIEKKKITQVPIVVYDRETKVIYHIMPDGSRVPAGTRRTVGRYSERNKK